MGRHLPHVYVQCLPVGRKHLPVESQIQVMPSRAMCMVNSHMRPCTIACFRGYACCSGCRTVELVRMFSSRVCFDRRVFGRSNPLRVCNARGGQIAIMYGYKYIFENPVSVSEQSELPRQLSARISYGLTAPAQNLSSNPIRLFRDQLSGERKIS